MDGMIREFALQMLRKLQRQPARAQAGAEQEKTTTVDGEDGDVTMSAPSEAHPGPSQKTDGHEGDENMEDGQLPVEELVHTPYLPEQIELPAQKAHVLQHVELLFALSVKVPEFLDRLAISDMIFLWWLTLLPTEFLQPMGRWM